MASSQQSSNAERQTHPLLEMLGVAPAAEASIFAYSAKIVCGKQMEGHCCCTSGVRRGVYATEVNIQNLNLATAPVAKAVFPLINSGAVVGREPNIVDFTTFPRRQIEALKLPPLGATMDDCCRISEMLLGATPNGEAALTIALLTILSTFELSVSVVYTATPLSGDGISIDVEYLPSRILRVR